MNFNTYKEQTYENIKKIENSNCKNLIELTIENFQRYANFFRKVKESFKEKVSVKEETLNEMTMYSTFLVDSTLKSTLVNDYIGAEIDIRVLNDFYIKYLFILYGDNYVSETYQDYKKLSKYNNLIEKNKEIPYKLQLEYNEISKKYSNLSDDYWIKLALDHLDKTSKHDKSLKAITNWLEGNNLLMDKVDGFIIPKNFKGEVDLQTYLVPFDDTSDFKKIYLPILARLNYIMCFVIYKFMNCYTEYKDDEIIKKMFDNLNYFEENK